LDKHVKLLDSPGIVFPTDGVEADGASPVAAALRNAVKLEKLADPIRCVCVWLRERERESGPGWAHMGGGNALAFKPPPMRP
jgi:ribosome biogenesis GTPase A